MPNNNGDNDDDCSNNPSLLDVEDDNARHRRLHELLCRTDHSTTTTASRAVPLPGPSLPLDNQLPVQPPTQLLTRLEAFLPQMAAANAELLQRAQQNPESVNIEHIDPANDSRYIQMDLGLGVFTVRRRRSDSSTSSSSSSDDSDTSGSSDHDYTQTVNDGQFNSSRDTTRSRDGSHSTLSSDNSESDSGSVSNGQNISPLDLLINAAQSPSQSGYRPIRSLPKRAVPSIVVLSDQPAAADSPRLDEP